MLIARSMLYPMLLLAAACQESTPQLADAGRASIDAGAREGDAGAPIGTDYEPCTPTHTPSNFEEGLAAGGTICLADGEYPGPIRVPSNTHIKAATLFGARVSGDAGEQPLLALMGENSTAEGIHASHPTGQSGAAGACGVQGANNRLRDVACIGAGKHRYAIALSIGGTGHELENLTVGGRESRYLAACFGGQDITVKNLLGVWSGGPSIANGGENEPTAVITNYSCDDVRWENIVALDPAYSYVRSGGIVKLATTFDEANHRVTYDTVVVRADPDVEQDASFMRAIDADSKNTSGGPSTDILFRNLYIRDMTVGAIAKDTYEDFTMESCTLVDVPNGAGQIGFGSSQVPLSCDGTANIETLFPWPNEGSVKRALCDERQSKWCDFPGPLRSYVLD